MSVLKREHRMYCWVSCILLRWRGILGSNSRAGIEVVLVVPIASLMEWFSTGSSEVRVDLGALANRMEP